MTFSSLREKKVYPLSRKVDYPVSFFEQPISNTTAPTIEPTIFWEQIGEELIVLNDILNKKSPEAVLLQD